MNEISYEELENAYYEELVTYGEFLKMRLFWTETEQLTSINTLVLKSSELA